MIPAGYLLKRVAPPPGWLHAPHVVDVCSVAGCVNDNLVDVQAAWEHNTFGVANSPAVLLRLASTAGVDPAGASLFYYEAYEQEIESDGWTFDPADWRPIAPAPSAVLQPCPEPPPAETRNLLGYDVVVFGDYLEHSPLSCNSIAETLKVNAHCLLDSLEAAKQAIDSGAFGGGCEEGVYKVFSVSRVARA